MIFFCRDKKLMSFTILAVLTLFVMPLLVIYLSVRYQLDSINFRQYFLSLILPVSYAIMSVFWWYIAAGLLSYSEKEAGLTVFFFVIQGIITFFIVVLINLGILLVKRR